MPDHTSEVLIHGEWGTLIGHRNSTGGWTVEGFTRPDSWVTHWQELPPPPTETMPAGYALNDVSA
jgi:hypothetical protein